MNTHRSSFLSGIRADADDDSEVIRVLDAYLSDIEAGHPADPDKLLADHPALAGPLRAYLKVMNLAGRLAEGTDASLDGVPLDPSTDVSMPGPASSLLSTLDLGPGPPPHIHLHELVDDREPLVMPRSKEMPHEDGAVLGRYQIQGEIARGGMGAILRGRDIDLGRELAIKVMLESHRGNSEVARRFVEEAQIGGQLQHPGIVPVYELGTFPERRPFFAMKLVKGRTLAALLSERKDHAGRGSHDHAVPGTEGFAPSQVDLPRLLSIYEQICQTMAYAHARGVIHRDLKPSNVMVGSFGEVQVMDWGLAKVLPTGGIADEAAPDPMNETVITTVRSGPAGSGRESEVGSVLGTPAYMAPEQARGETDRIDERADVFGLGAILCEILTGRPPFVASTRDELRTMAARGYLTDALRRLDDCSADSELIGLARDCLAAAPDQRPRSAVELARRMTAYLASVQERLRASELARVEVQARADEETKRRAVADELAREARRRADEERKRVRMTAALAASVVLTMGVVCGGWAYMSRQRLERASLFTQALGEVEGIRAQAERVGDDLALWHSARDAAHAAERLLHDAPDGSTRERAAKFVREVIRDAASAENDQKLLTSLLEIRSAWADVSDGTISETAYADAFREAGINVASLSPAEAGIMIASRPPAVRVSLATALDYWAALRRNRRRDEAGALRLTALARAADVDPWRNQLRDLFHISARDVLATRLKDLARTARIEKLPAVTLQLLGATLLIVADPADAEAVLRHAQQLYPGDIWLNLSLAQSLKRLGRSEEAIRYYMVTRSLLPESAHELAHALDEQGETEQAIAVFQDLTRLRPENAQHPLCLAETLKSSGRGQESVAVLDAAVAIARACVKRDGTQPLFHCMLGDALRERTRFDEAIAANREAVRLAPYQPMFLRNLGRSLAAKGNLDDAVATYSKALRLDPYDPLTQSLLGAALATQEKLDEAIAAFREAVRILPSSAQGHANLGTALCDKGELEASVAEFRIAFRLNPRSCFVRRGFGNVLLVQGKVEEAMAEFRESLRINPEHGESHVGLGNALFRQEKIEEAIVEYREAVRLNSEAPLFHDNLAIALSKQLKLDEAVAEHREAIRLKPNLASAHRNLGIALAKQGKLDEAIAEYREAIRLKPGHFEAYASLGPALADQGKLDEATAAYHEAIRLKPDDALSHSNLGSALARKGSLDEAIAEFQEAIRLKPNLATAYSNLGAAFEDKGQWDRATHEYRAAIRIKPDSPSAHLDLGVMLTRLGKLDEAISECREALRLNPNCVEAHHDLGWAFILQGRLNDAITELRLAIRIEPGFHSAHSNLGAALAGKGNMEEAAAAFREAIRLKPDDSDVHHNLGLLLSTNGNLKAAIAELREAERFNPGSAETHYDLGINLKALGKHVEAIQEYETALRLKPDYAEAHINLGLLFSEQGRFAEGLAEVKRGHELGSRNPDWRYPSAEWVKNAERLVALDTKLPAILSGQAKPVDHIETLGLARLCYEKKLHVASARFWTEAFQAQPKLADDMNVQNRYNAACAAALAGSGQGKNDPPLGEEKKAHWRKQAIDWLEADLKAWSKILESRPPQARQAITQTLMHWKADVDLIGLRDAAALAKLPDDEQKDCRALWADVDALLTKCQGTSSKSGH